MDAVDNRATATIASTVRYGIRTLYYIDKAHKSGSTIPIRIQLIDGGGANLSSPLRVVHALSVLRVSDQTSDVLENPE